MTIAFTICSNNYLAYAKTLGDSFLEYHPEAKFVIGLVDKLADNFDYGSFKRFEIIPVERLEIKEFEEIHSKYNVIELNTAVKPSYIHYLFQNYGADKLIYIDPDILVVSRFEEVLTLLDEYNIILTPHILSPVDDEHTPTDYHTLRGGVFNLGFIALSNYQKVTGFVNWWHDRVVKYGFADFGRSMFYDQLWINYVPTFYDNYYILKHPGYNMANWNLHERFLSKSGEATYIVNNLFELRFFHFSGYRYQQPELISTHLSRYTFTSRPDLIELFTRYQTLLKGNSVDQIRKLDVFYYPKLNQPSTLKKQSLGQKMSYRIKRSLKILIKGRVS